MRNIRLLIVVKNIEGGTGTFLFNLINLKKNLLPNRLIIKILVLEKPKYFRHQKTKISFFRPKNYSNKKFSLNVGTLGLFIHELWWIKNGISEFNPSVVLGIDLHCNLLIGICKFIFIKQFPTIFTTHIYLKETMIQKSTPQLYQVLKKLIPFLYNRADLLTGVSKGVSTSLKNDYNIKKEVQTIYYGIAKTQITFKPLPKTPIIISICRFDSQKDFTTLIESFKTVQTHIPSKLWMVGEGPLKPFIMNLVSKNHLEQKIKFFGWVKKPNRLLLKADVFILSTYREGFPYTILEAMSQGKAIISTNIPFGPSEALSNGRYGILVPPSNQQKLSESIVDLLTHPSKHAYYSRKAHERSNFFSLDKMLKNYARLIDKLSH